MNFLSNIALKIAYEFNTKKEMDNYLKKHPAADKSLHSVKQKEQRRKNHQINEENGLHKNLLNKKLNEVVDSNEFSDHSNVSSNTFSNNMEHTLNHISDDKTKEETISDNSLITKHNKEQFKKNLSVSMRSTIDKYSAGMFSETSKKTMDSYQNVVLSAIDDAINDGSLGDVSQKELGSFFQDEIKRLIYQEIETRKRSMGDHGIRHLVGNAVNSCSILDKLEDGGIKVTGKDKLLAISTMVNHDIGYTLGQVATNAGKGGFHKSYSGVVAFEEKERYEKIFGKDGADLMVGNVETYENGKPKLYHKNENDEEVSYSQEEAYNPDGSMKISQKDYQNCKIHHKDGGKGTIQFHDSSNYDWKNDPIRSAVSLADCTALFGKDKVQELFYENDEAMNEVIKMQCIISRNVDEKNPDEKTKKAFYGFKEKMGKFIDGFEDVSAWDKDLMHKQVNEMSIGAFSTIQDILTRSSGVLDGFSYDSKSNTVSVNTHYSEKGNVVGTFFGNNFERDQWKKLYKDIKGSGKIQDNSKGREMFIQSENSDSRIIVNINGFTGVSSEIKEMYKNVPSMPIRQNIARFAENHNNKELAKIEGRLSGGEKGEKSRGELLFGAQWNEVKEILKDARKGKDIKDILKRLKNIDFNEEESKYLFGGITSSKISSIMMKLTKNERIARKVIAWIQHYDADFNENFFIRYSTFGDMKFLLNYEGYQYVYEIEFSDNAKDFGDFYDSNKAILKNIYTPNQLLSFIKKNRYKIVHDRKVKL